MPIDPMEVLFWKPHLPREGSRGRRLLQLHWATRSTAAATHGAEAARAFGRVRVWCGAAQVSEVEERSGVIRSEV